MAFGRPKAGAHHSANQVRQGFKQRSGLRSRKHMCPRCGVQVSKSHFKENPDHLLPALAEGHAEKK